MSYVQVAYRGGHISFVGGKRVCGSTTSRRSKEREAQIAEQERQFREILEYCPAGLIVVDEDGRLLFHNARLREMLGYDEEEMELIDTGRFWHDLDQRSRIIETLRERGGQLLNEEVVWKTKQGQPIHVLMSYVQVAYQGGHISFAGGKRLCWVYDITALQARRGSAPTAASSAWSRRSRASPKGSSSTTPRTGWCCAIPATASCSTLATRPI